MPEELVKWEYTMLYKHMTYHPIGGEIVPFDIWEEKDKNGKSSYNKINELGERGWEMVSCLAWGMKGDPDYILFIFKRPLKEKKGV